MINQSNPYENPSGIPMDSQMKAMYKHIYKIDPDECLPLRGNNGKLEIKVSDKKILLPEFLKPRTRIISLDNFSTKKVNEDSIKSSGMPSEAAEVCKRFYIEVYRAWGLVEHEGKGVGIAYRFDAYNGIPRLIPDPEQFINQPNMNERYAELFLRLSKEDRETQPLIYRIVRYALLKDFLNANPITGIGQLKHFFKTLPKLFIRKKGDKK